MEKNFFPYGGKSGWKGKFFLCGDTCQGNDL